MIRRGLSRGLYENAYNIYYIRKRWGIKREYKK
jgi:hypothetical protein